MINTLLFVLEKIDTNKYLQVIKYLLFPIICLVEIILFLIIWRKCVVEICSNDELVNFLDDNDFQLDRIKLFKKDIITPESPLFSKNDEELEFIINNQFSEAISDIIRKDMILDIENYISITTNVKIHSSKIKIYETSIVYYRINFVFKYFIFLCLFGLISGIILFLLNLYNIL